jgi:hypothetical protein
MELLLGMMLNLSSWDLVTLVALFGGIPIVASFTDYLENKILNHNFGGVAWTPPATLYFGLSTTTIADDGTGITEPAGNAYARVAVTNNTTNFPNTTTGSKSNGTEVAFPTATGSWGTCTDFFLADAASGGNVVGYGALTTPKTIGNGDTARFAPAALVITLT